MNRYRFYLISLVGVLFLFFAATVKVNGQGEYDMAAKREFYRELEEDYIQRLREVMEDKGYGNAGISMTKIYDRDGSREYTVKIHHKRIDRLTEKEQQLLKQELEELSFGDVPCSILHKFLSYEQ